MKIILIRQYKRVEKSTLFYNPLFKLKLPILL